MAVATATSIRKIEKYNPDKIELIKQSLQQLIDAGQPRYYEIQVDGLKMVGKTTDLTRFESYEPFLSDETDEIKFMLYQGNSHKYDSFTHYLKEDSYAVMSAPKPTLNDVPEVMEDKIKQALRERDVLDYKKRIVELEEELEENKDYVLVLENQVEELQKKVEILTLTEISKNRNQDLIMALVSKGSDFIKRNPQVLSGIPFVGETIAGDIIKQQHEEEMRMQYEQLLLKQNVNKEPTPEPNASFAEKE
jgi:hypothetical protein